MAHVGFWSKLLIIWETYCGLPHPKVKYIDLDAMSTEETPHLQRLQPGAPWLQGA